MCGKTTSPPLLWTSRTATATIDPPSDEDRPEHSVRLAAPDRIIIGLGAEPRILQIQIEPLRCPALDGGRREAAVIEPEAPALTDDDALSAVCAVHGVIKLMAEVVGGAGCFEVLLLLRRNAMLGRQETPIADLCCDTGAPYPTLVRWVDELARSGHVDKRIDSFDRRRVNVAMTETSAARMDDLLARIRPALQALARCRAP